MAVPRHGVGVGGGIVASVVWVVAVVAVMPAPVGPVSVGVVVSPSAIGIPVRVTIVVITRRGVFDGRLFWHHAGGQQGSEHRVTDPFLLQGNDLVRRRLGAD